MGALSSGTIAIRVSIAAGGALTQTSSAQSAERRDGEAMCLWLNTATALYHLKPEAAPSETHRLRWTAGGQSFLLRAGSASPPLVAARRPGCPEGEARLSAERTSAGAPGEPMTLLVVPE